MGQPTPRRRMLYILSRREMFGVYVWGVYLGLRGPLIPQHTHPISCQIPFLVRREHVRSLPPPARPFLHFPFDVEPCRRRRSRPPVGPSWDLGKIFGHPTTPTSVRPRDRTDIRRPHEPVRTYHSPFPAMGPTQCWEAFVYQPAAASPMAMTSARRIVKLLRP